jgi:hypothetical protein
VVEDGVRGRVDADGEGDGEGEGERIPKSFRAGVEIEVTVVPFGVGVKGEAWPFRRDDLPLIPLPFETGDGVEGSTAAVLGVASLSMF